MNVEQMIMKNINTKFPKLFVTEIVDNEIIFLPEQDDGFVEYKRTLIDCNDKKNEKYATQMRWRISKNLKNQYAIYYIGIDDDGTIVGLSNEEIIECIERFVIISNLIRASIIGIQIIHINKLTIIKIRVKMKKINDNYLVEFEEKNDNILCNQ